MNNSIIFISYASENRDKIRQLYNKLKEKGLDPWMDEKKLNLGDKWESSIEKKIKESEIFFACLSKKYETKRGFVHKELKIALEVQAQCPEDEIFIMPIRLEECEIPASLTQLHCVDYFGPDDFKKIISAIRAKFDFTNKQNSSKATNEVPNRPKKTIEFSNRQHELDLICNPAGAPLLVIDAPPGFGKSRLLQEVEKWFKIKKSDEWVCARIELNLKRYYNNPEKILDDIAQELMLAPLTLGEPEDLIAKITDRGKNIILLFDGIEANHSVTEWLKDNFVHILVKTLANTTFTGRVVFAGRYIINAGWNWRNFRTLKLTPIDENIIRQVVLKELEKKHIAEPIKRILAKELAFLSGGHPGIIENILQNQPKGGWAFAVEGDRIKPDSQNEIFQKNVASVIDNIFAEIRDKNLINVLIIMSIFRRFDLNIVQALEVISSAKQPNANMLSVLKKISNVLEPFRLFQNSALDLFSRLVQTGLVSSPTSERPYYHDAIIRKLMLLRIQMDDTKLYHELNNLACAIYEAWIDDKNVAGDNLLTPLADQTQADYIGEGFYHFLNSLNKDQKADDYNKIVAKIGIFHIA